MSSTNRSKSRQEHISDYYITPVDKIEEFLIKFNDTEEIFINDPIILDVCAGGDSNHNMSYPTAIRNVYNLPTKTIDIREDSLADTKTNYLTYELNYKPNIIITNPPFNFAIEIVQKALNDVADNGYVIMLLRLNFFGSGKRFQFFENNLPKYCFVHNKRISFTDDNKTDSIEYCHMVWQKGYSPSFAKLKVI